MGWTISLRSNKEILENEVNEIVDNLPEEYKASFPLNLNTKQEWGWITAVDIFKPVDNEITLGGSGIMSGRIGLKFSEYFCKQLELNGHRIKQLE